MLSCVNTNYNNESYSHMSRGASLCVSLGCELRMIVVAGAVYNAARDGVIGRV